MTGRTPAEVETFLEEMLEPGEALLGAVTNLAGTFALTDRRVVIVREGRTYRPTTGVRSWALSPANVVACGVPHGGVGRLMVGRGRKATSFFVKERDWDAALEIVSMANRITHHCVTKGLAVAAPASLVVERTVQLGRVVVQPATPGLVIRPA